MEQKQDTQAMLALIDRPAFCVQEGVITHCNAAAKSRLIDPGTPIDPLLQTGHTEYHALTDHDCLWLTIALSGAAQGCTVTRIQEQDIFVLDDVASPELKAMALAAQSLREPLSSVMITADRLMPILQRTDAPDAAELAAHLNRGLFQMLRILGNMSDADRYQSSCLERMETRNITALMNELFDGITAAASIGGVNIQFTNLDTPVYSLVDSEKLERAVYNILSNAVKFTPAGGQIHARFTRQDDFLYLTVQDGGHGLSPRLQGTLYTRFLRQPGLESGENGIGLGMVLIRAAAAAHGGTVLAEQTDRGLRLTMSLKIRQNRTGAVHSPILRVDYAGEWDHSMIELSESLPASAYLDRQKSDETH